MKSLPCILAALAMVIGLTSCDSIKSKALAVIDKKIEETGGMPGPAEGDGEQTADEVHQEPVRQLAGDEFEGFTGTPGHVVVVDFYADWCGPCRQLAPVLEGIANASNGKILLGKFDIDKYKDVAGREGVQGIPDVRIFVNGKQVDRFVGAPPKMIVTERIEGHLAKISAAPAKPKPAPAKPNPAVPTQPAQPGTQPAPQPEEPAEPKEEPKIKPMDKEWLPPGLQRKGT